VKLELVSGNGQTDTIGNLLAHPIVVKVSVNGTPTSGYSVQFQASGCNQTDIITTLSQPDGTAVYGWSLASEIGQQSLKAYVLNNKNQKVDSVTVAAMALPTGPGWHNSGCSIQGGSPVAAFCKISTGRLFACYTGTQTYLRYSDDNGVSWNAVKSLGNSHTITYVVSTPSDEVIAFTKGADGTFYSNDAGQSWKNFGVPPFNSVLFPIIVCTPSGKLIATSVNSPMCISLDKGKTWASVPLSAFTLQNLGNPFFYDPTEDKNGNLYIVEGSNNVIFESTDVGKTWSLVQPIGVIHPGTEASFYIDQNNWFYKSIIRLNPGIFISKDGGVTYNMLVNASLTAYIDDMSVQSDGEFYYEDITSGLYSYDGNSSKRVFAFDATGRQPYIVAKNNNIIVANLRHNYVRYYTK